MSMKSAYPYYLANKAVFANEDLEVIDKHTGEVATRVARPTTRWPTRQWPPPSARRRPWLACRRTAVATLHHCADRFEERYDELAEILVVEGGKVIKDARSEVQRLIDTFRIAAEEATRIGGEVLPMDIAPRSESFIGMWKRVPIGPVSFITPFNFPVQPGRAQDCAGHRGRLPVRAQAGGKDARGRAGTR